MTTGPHPMIRTVRLAELEALAGVLGERVRSSGFVPNVIVPIEAAGRVPGIFLARQLGCAVFPVRIQRPTSRWKRLLAPLARRAPRGLLDWLRRREAAATFHERGERVLAADTAPVRLAGKQVLIVDDAADSGATLIKARDWAQAAGAAEVRTAVLGATTSLGREVVDYFLWEQMCRFPWSSDSDEQAAHEALHHSLARELQAKIFRPDA